MEYGHTAINGRGFCMDSWGVGPFVIVARGKRYYFEDSDRFGPSFINTKTGDPTNEMIPPKSPFWKVWKRWKEEGRQTVEGKPLGTRRNQISVRYCVHTDVRKDLEVD